MAEAARRGHDVVAVIRASSANHDPLPSRVDVRLCEVYEGRGVDEAVKGGDAIVSCLGIRRRNPLNPWSPLHSPKDTASRSTAHILDAMERADIRRIACISAAGVGASLPRVGLALRCLIEHSNLRPAYRDLNLMEQLLAYSRYEWLALRPTTLTNSRYSTPARPTSHYGLFSCIPRATVARALIDFADGACAHYKGCCMVTG